jgi:hypothetical protein
MVYNTDNRGLGTHVHDLTEIMSDGLDIFNLPEYDNSITHGRTIEHHMITALNENNNVFEFVIPSEGHDYTYLPLTRLEGEIQITKGNGAAVTDTDFVAPVNLISSALFRQVECEVNGFQVADLTSPTYHYKAYLETLITYGLDAKNTHLQAALYEPDSVGHEEDFTNESESFKKRKSWVIAHNNKLYFSTPIFIDFFQSQRYLIPGPTIKLKFLKNEDKFCLLSATNDWKIKVNNLTIFTRKIKVHDDITQKHKSIILKQPALYPLKQSKIKTYVINGGISAKTLPGVFRGRLPTKAIFCFVKSEAFNGSFKTNPFFFQPFDVSYIGFLVNGSPYPSRVLQPDFSGGKYIREYRHFLDNVGISHENESNCIDLERFKTNSTIFAYDLSGDLCNGFHKHPPSSGFIDIELHFKNALTENITVIVYGTYDEVCEIYGQGETKITLQ